MPERTGSGGEVLPIAECRLDLAGLHRQRERYRAVGRHVTAIERRPEVLEVRFDPGLDRSLIEEVLAVERECCPFFVLDYDPDARRLLVSVERAEQDPGLDAIVHALDV